MNLSRAAKRREMIKDDAIVSLDVSRSTFRERGGTIRLKAKLNGGRTGEVILVASASGWRHGDSATSDTLPSCISSFNGGLGTYYVTCITDSIARTDIRASIYAIFT